MDCHITTKDLKINLKRNIGTVILIVEGSSDEFDLFKQIFQNILHYNYIEKSRNKQNFKKYDEFVMKGNENSRVIVINAKNSNISTIKKDSDYINEMYIMLYNEYRIDIKNSNIYFVWDRDYASNPSSIVKELLRSLNCSNVQNDLSMQGMLILSYPNVESYIISSFDKKIVFLEFNNLKNYVKEKQYWIKDINKHSLLKAVVKMNKDLLTLGIDGYDIDEFGQISLNVFDKQEELFAKRKHYNLISLISIILLDLNIITVRI